MVVTRPRLGDAQAAGYYRPITLKTVEEYGDSEARDRAIAEADFELTDHKPVRTQGIAIDLQLPQPPVIGLITAGMAKGKLIGMMVCLNCAQNQLSPVSVRSDMDERYGSIRVRERGAMGGGSGARKMKGLKRFSEGALFLARNCGSSLAGANTR